MKMFFSKTLVMSQSVIFLFMNCASALEFESLRVPEGYPSGFLSDCPGVTKEARITKSSLKHLIFVHFGNGDYITAKRTVFNFYQMKELAKIMDFKRKTVVYMNGYLDSAVSFPFTPLMGVPYAKLGYNVLLLDYNWFTTMVYPKAARFLKPVSKYSAQMLANLTTYGLDPKKLELTGLSLGAHGVGFIGKHYRELTGRNVSRITGLDPSGPCFRHASPDDRIDASNADFVDIIHCNNEVYGMATPMGHVDYYVNGGEYQLNDIPELPCASLCSHLKSFTYWISSLQHPDQFIATKCESIQDARDRKCFSGNPVTNLMGPKADRNKTGLFYVATMPYYPFSMGEKGLKKENDPSLEYIRMVNSKDVMTI